MTSNAAARARVDEASLAVTPSATSYAPYQHRGTRAIQRMVEYAPSTGGLALWVRHVDLPDDADASAGSEATPPVTTDGYTVFYSADFDELPLAAQVGWVAHEVLHMAPAPDTR